MESRGCCYANINAKKISCITCITRHKENCKMGSIYMFDCFLFVCLFGFFFLKGGGHVSLQNVSHLRRRHHCRWKAALYPALIAIEELGFLSMPHLLWYVTTLYNGHLRGPVFLLLTCSSVVTGGGGGEPLSPACEANNTYAFQIKPWWNTGFPVDELILLRAVTSFIRMWISKNNWKQRNWESLCR